MIISPAEVPVFKPQVNSQGTYIFSLMEIRSILCYYHFEVFDIYHFSVTGLISLNRNGRKCRYNTILLLVFLCIVSLTVPSYVENQKVQKQRQLTWKRNEVLAWHIPLPDMAHSLFSSKMKPCYTVPMKKSSRD